MPRRGQIATPCFQIHDMFAVRRKSWVQIFARTGGENGFLAAGQIKQPYRAQFDVIPRREYDAFPMPLAGKTFTIGPKMKNLPVKQLDVNSGDYLHWSGDSSKVYFSMGDELFSSELKNAFAFVADSPAELPKAVEIGMKIGFRQSANRPTATTVISGARIVTMKGDEVIEDGRIVVRENRIAAIGRTADVAVPPGATLIDARGKTVMPGIVDVHWHGGMGENQIIPQQRWVNYD